MTTRQLDPGTGAPAVTGEGSADREPRHPIRVVAHRTGITLHVLRAWERRYAVVTPQRSDGGQRLYSDADIARLKLVRDAVASGRSISQVAELPDAALAALVAQDRQATTSPRAPALDNRPDHDVSWYLAACLEAAERMDEEALHRLLLRAMVALRPLEFLEEVIAPLLFQVGERWHAGMLRPSHEHAVSIAVRRVLTFLLSAYEAKPGAPTMVASTLTGDPHEFGAMLASVLAAEAGWRVLYLGPSLPAEEIARAVTVSGASAAAVSAVHERPVGELIDELERLRSLLPREIRLLVGGRTAQRHAGWLARVPGLELMDLRDLRAALPRTVE